MTNYSSINGSSETPQQLHERILSKVAASAEKLRIVLDAPESERSKTALDSVEYRFRIIAGDLIADPDIKAWLATRPEARENVDALARILQEEWAARSAQVRLDALHAEDPAGTQWNYEKVAESGIADESPSLYNE